ncbi:MAG: class I SAM-dependent methyltransferase, partial [Thermomicrobiales bacterium]
MEYRDLLGEVHAALQPDVYLEIGVRNGASLALSRGKTIGVDPAMADLIRVSTLRPWTKLYRETSDAFFAAREASATLDGGRLELAFIDGLHLFEQVLRDLIHVEAWAAPGALIVIHDVLPPTVHSTSREPLRGAWVGDVWKIV